MKIIGIDIGGTFTDVILSDKSTGQVFQSKVPTTPDKLTVGVENGVRDVLEASGCDGGDITYVAHGTTVATNAILEKRGARTALVTTKGFSDILEIRHRARPAGMLYDMHLQWPEPLAPRFLRFEVDERVDSEGNILRAPDRRELGLLVNRLKRSKVESVAVSFLWSFLNPRNEIATVRAIRNELPDVYVTRSSDLLPKIGEYERMSTSVVNSYVGPQVDEYLRNMRAGLEDLKIKTELFIMQSNGGVTTVADARNRPAAIVESGPAAGVAAAVYVGMTVGLENLISFDMGGTTSKACLVRNSQPSETAVFQTGGAHREGQLVKGTGYEIAIPSVDLVEIGSGGGSIVWIDQGGKLRVGPKSAAASPGPACYGKGGSEPTVTDADLVLGYLNPDYFLGGKMKIFKDRAVQALKKVGTQMRMDPQELASGVFKILNSQISDALRVVSTKRGYDPRDFAIIGFGGAGPLHSALLLEELDIHRLVIPPYPGLHSAVGLIESPLMIDLVQSYFAAVENLNVTKLESLFKTMETAGTKTLLKGGVPRNNIHLLRFVNLRYENQGSTLSIPFSGRASSKNAIEQAISEFHQMHRSTYGFESSETKVELTDLRVRAIEARQKSMILRKRRSDKKIKDAVKGFRVAYFEKARDFLKCTVYDRSKLGVGSHLLGPAILEQTDTTVVVPPEYRAQVDDFENVVISVK